MPGRGPVAPAGCAGRFAYEEAAADSAVIECEEFDERSAGPAERKTVTACVLIIGNEILSGRMQDANLAFLANGLNDVGVRLREARIIPDDPAAIVATVNEVRSKFDYVFTTGGIGPTHDDITAECIADGVRRPVDPASRGASGCSKAIIRRARSTRRGCAWRTCRKARSCCSTRSRARRVSGSATCM